jgi:hypothetical protein
MKVNPFLGAGLMRWKGLTCLAIVLLGLALFLYGANSELYGIEYYDNVFGWAGLYLFVGGILAYVFLRIFSRLTKGTSEKKT